MPKSITPTHDGWYWIGKRRPETVAYWRKRDRRRRNAEPGWYVPGREGWLSDLDGQKVFEGPLRSAWQIKEDERQQRRLEGRREERAKETADEKRQRKERREKRAKCLLIRTKGIEHARSQAATKRERQIVEAAYQVVKREDAARRRAPHGGAQRGAGAVRRRISRKP